MPVWRDGRWRSRPNGLGGEGHGPSFRAPERPRAFELRAGQGGGREWNARRRPLSANRCSDRLPCDASHRRPTALGRRLDGARCCGLCPPARGGFGSGRTGPKPRRVSRRDGSVRWGRSSASRTPPRAVDAPSLPESVEGRDGKWCSAFPAREEASASGFRSSLEMAGVSSTAPGLARADRPSGAGRGRTSVGVIFSPEA